MPAGPAQLNSAGGISSMRPGGGGGGGGFQSKKLMVRIVTDVLLLFLWTEHQYGTQNLSDIPVL